MWRLIAWRPSRPPIAKASPPGNEILVKIAPNERTNPAKINHRFAHHSSFSRKIKSISPIATLYPPYRNIPSAAALSIFSGLLCRFSDGYLVTIWLFIKVFAFSAKGVQ